MTKPSDREKAYARCTRELERLIEDAGDLSLDEMTVQALRTAIEAMAAVAAAPEGAQGADYYYVEEGGSGWTIYWPDRPGYFYLFGHGEEAEIRAKSVCLALNKEHLRWVATPPQPQDAAALSESGKDIAVAQAVEFAIYVERQAKGEMVKAAQRFLSLPYSQEVAARLVDAVRYRLLRRGQKWSVINAAGDSLRADDLDAEVDAARAAGGGG